MNFFGIAGSPLNALAQEEQFPSEQFVKTGANATQHGGTHYKTLKFETWDVIHDWGLGYMDGNAVKYLSRWRRKGGIEDLRKAKHYIEKLIEQELNK